MYKANPVDVRKTMLVVDSMEEAGMDFVPIPILNDEHKAMLVAELKRVMAIVTEVTQ